MEKCSDELAKMVSEAVTVKKVERFKVSDLLLPQQGLVPEVLEHGKQTFQV